MFKPLVITLLSFGVLLSPIARAEPPSGAAHSAPPGFPVEKPDPRMPSIIKALRANQAKWKAQKLTDYTFTLARSCFCAPEFTAPIQITVKGGKVVKAVSHPPRAIPANGRVAAPAAVDARDRAMTVDGLFKTVQEAVNGKAAQIDVKYDGKYGYPSTLFIDRIRMMADEEMGLTATDLEPLRVRPHR